MPSSGGLCGPLSAWFYNVTHTPISRRKFLMGAMGCGVVLVVIIVLAATLSASGQSSPQEKGGKYVIQSNPLVVGSDDVLWRIRDVRGNLISGLNLLNTTDFDTNFAQLKNGWVASQVWKVRTDCNGAQFKDVVPLTLEGIDVAYRIDRRYEQVTLVRDYADITRAFREKKLGVFLALDGGHAIGNKLSVLRMYSNLGVKFMALTSNCTTPWAGAAGDAKTKNLTGFGEVVVKEMNRLGMVIDLSGASKQTQLAAIEKSKAPLVFTSSNAYNLTKHPFNVEDQVLDKLKTKPGSLIMVSFSEVQLPNNTVQAIIGHLNYLKAKLGVQFLGIGGNYDSPDKVTLSNQTAVYSELFELLEKSKWSTEELKRLAGGNFKNLLQAVDKVAEEMVKEEPSEDKEGGEWIQGLSKSCFSDFNKDFPAKDAPTEPPSTTTQTTTVPTTSKATTEATAATKPTNKPPGS